jgi:hypothetical protein
MKEKYPREEKKKGSKSRQKITPESKNAHWGALRGKNTKP